MVNKNKLHTKTPRYPRLHELCEKALGWTALTQCLGSVNEELSSAPKTCRWGHDWVSFLLVKMIHILEYSTHSPLSIAGTHTHTHKTATPLSNSMESRLLFAAWRHWIPMRAPWWSWWHGNGAIALWGRSCTTARTEKSSPPQMPLQNHTGWPLYKAIFLYRKFFVKFLFQATTSLVYDFVGGTSLATTGSVQGRVTNSVGIHFLWCSKPLVCDFVVAGDSVETWGGFWFCSDHVYNCTGCKFQTSVVWASWLCFGRMCCDLKYDMEVEEWEWKSSSWL